MKPAYEENPMGHVWETYPDGEVRLVQLGEFCEGPRCVKCEYVFCYYCHDLPKDACVGSPLSEDI